MLPNNLEILYQDEYFVAINKPAGLLVHPTLIDRHETLSALRILRDRLGQRVHAVHRLDKPTSGVLLFALHSEAARKGADELARLETRKTYLAVVRGFTPERGIIEFPLGEIPDKILDRKNGAPKEPKPASTEYRRLAKTELPVFVSRYPSSRYSLVAVYPKTGRMHQIRRHLRQIFHPIIGDTTHGDHKHNRHFREHRNSRRMLLAATELSFVHPYTKVDTTIVAPLDEEFVSAIRSLGWLDAIPGKWLGDH
ncbi:MAG: hypothetical protein GY866_42150 [Proteobacteria bacterium]|nr:hypothetical protein [Pseudomonadota bacterium]